MIGGVSPPAAVAAAVTPLLRRPGVRGAGGHAGANDLRPGRHDGEREQKHGVQESPHQYPHCKERPANRSNSIFSRATAGAEAAGRYRLAGRLQDPLAGRGSDERVRALREEAAGLSRQGKHAEAAGVYRRLVTGP